MTRTKTLMGSASHIDVSVLLKEVGDDRAPSVVRIHANPRGNQATSMAWGRNFSPAEVCELADLLLRAAEHAECHEVARLVLGDD